MIHGHVISLFGPRISQSLPSGSFSFSSLVLAITSSFPRAMFNLHLQAAEQDLVKIISLDSHLQVTLGRRPASECSRQNGFFPQEDNPSISREHATLQIDANQQVCGYSVPQSNEHTDGVPSCLSRMRDQSWELSSMENVFHLRIRVPHLLSSRPETSWYATAHRWRAAESVSTNCEETRF